MNETMRHAAKGWHRLYYGLMLGFGVVLIGASLAVAFIPGMDRYADTYGLSATACVIAAGFVLYFISAYFLMAKQGGQSLAMLIGSMLFTLSLLYGLNATDPGYGAWIYVVVWLVSVFMVGMYGTTYSLGAPLIPAIYVLLQGDFAPTLISAPSWALIGGSLVAAIGAFLFWRDSGGQVGDAQLNKLSGMLKSNQQQSAILIQSIADGVIVTGTDGKITLINLAAAVLTGWSIADATGVDVNLVVKLARENGEELGEGGAPFAKVLSDIKPTSMIAQINSRDGTSRVISLVISPVVIGGKDMAGAVAVMRDVSEERAAEKQRAEFISTASHEMRTPVAAIEGYLALALNDKVSTIDSRAHGYLEKAHASTQHLGKLFQDLLTSAKAEDGRLSNHPVVVEMGSFLEQLVEDLRFAAQKKSLQAEFIVGSTNDTVDATSGADNNALKVVKPLYYIHADPERLREVITNIFDNAVKYTDQGKISVGLTGNNEVVQFYIHDTGPGIPKDDIPHLFQKFYRVDNSATRTIGGTGLGLFICRKIVELYQGRLWVESELGKGSTFFINLPRLSTSRAASLQTAETAAPTTASTPGSTPKNS